MDQAGLSPLDYAVRAQAEDAVSFLLDEQKVAVTPMALYLAAGRSEELFEQLLSHNPSPDICTMAEECALRHDDREARSRLQEKRLQGIPPMDADSDAESSAFIEAVYAKELSRAQGILYRIPAQKLLSQKWLMKLGRFSHTDTLFEELLISALNKTQWNPNFLDLFGRTPLFYAILANNEVIIDLLLKRGAEVNHRDDQLFSPLALACQNGSLPIVKKLIQAGADPNQRITINHITAVYLAAAKKQPLIVQYLLAHGASPMIPGQEGFYLIHMLAKAGLDHLIRLVVSRGTSVDLPDHHGHDARHCAARSGQTKTLALLLSLQNASLTKEDGASLLGLASANGHEETVRWLFAHGVIPSLENTGLCSPFALAALGTNPSAILPLYAPYKVSEAPASVRTALLGAIRMDRLDSVQTIYSHVISVNSELANGDTGLHFAARFGALHCTQWLLSHGADPLLPCESGETAIELAAANSSWEQFRSLFAFQQPMINRRYTRGETLAHIAAKAGNIRHLSLLVAEQVNLDIGDNQGCTPLYRVAETGNEPMIRFLLACGANPSIRSKSGIAPIDVLPEDQRHLRELFDQCTFPIEGETIVHRAVRVRSLFAVQFLGEIVDPKMLNQTDQRGTTPLALARTLNETVIIDALVNRGAK